MALLWFTAASLYALIATAAMCMTWNERVMKKPDHVIFEILGMLACILWPATLVAVGVSATLSSRQDGGFR